MKGDKISSVEVFKYLIVRMRFQKRVFLWKIRGPLQLYHPVAEAQKCLLLNHSPSNEQHCVLDSLVKSVKPAKSLSGLHLERKM